jgi:hypothetical protein
MEFCIALVSNLGTTGEVKDNRLICWRVQMLMYEIALENAPFAIEMISLGDIAIKHQKNTAVYALERVSENVKLKRQWCWRHGAVVWASFQTANQSL